MYRDSRRLRIVFALLILTSFTLITIDYRAGEGTVLAGLRSGANAVFGPVQRAVTSVVRPVGNALSSLGDLGSLREDIARLEGDNEDLRNQLRQVDDQRRRLEETEQLLGLAGRGRLKIVAARVVAIGGGPFESTVTIDAGKNDGIVKGQTVVNGDGLVGRVLTVGPWTSTVLMADDATFEVGVQLAANGEAGLLRGDGRRPMLLTLLNQDASVQKGQAVVTGADGTFVPGIPIGVVAKVERRPGSLTVTVEVTPYVTYSSVDTVGIIIVAPRTIRRDALLPTPPPTPSASASPTPSASPSVSASPSAGAAG
jgi:rod shape-determining protein MreC